MMGYHRWLFCLGVIILLGMPYFGCSNIADYRFVPTLKLQIAQEDPIEDYWPTDGWRVSTPEDQTMNGTVLEDMREHIYEEDLWLDSVVVIKNGYLVFEDYPSGDYDEDTIHYVCSVTKSFTSALMGIALKQGYFESVGQKAFEFFPDVQFQNMSPEKENITLEHILTMTPGLEWDEWSIPYTENGNDFHDLWHYTGNSFYYLLNKPMIAKPGEVWQYNTGCSNLLMKILTRITGTNGYSFAEENLFEPLGIDDYYWLADSQGHPAGGHDLYLTPRDMAKFGFLYLKNGTWEDTQLIEPWYVNTSQQTHFNLHDFYWRWINDGYGYHWWTETYRDYYYANGQDGQLIIIMPQYDLVVAINGYTREGPFNARDGDGMSIFRKYIIPSIRDYQPEESENAASSTSESVEDTSLNLIIFVSVFLVITLSVLVLEKVLKAKDSYYPTKDRKSMTEPRRSVI